MTRRVVSVAILATLAACGAQQPESPPGDTGAVASTAPAPFTDPSGNPVTIAALPVRRIVSTMQNMTDWLVALGAESLLVARTDYDRQPQLAALPSIGGGLDPSPEAIVALRPDVIIGWRDRSSANLQRALASFGIPVISLETTDTADIYANLAQLGRLVGREARADSLARALRSELAAAHASCGSTVPPSVLIVVSSDPPMTAGGGTWLNEIIGLACLRNAFGDLTAPWPTISMEAIAARQPHWILTSIGARPGQRLEELRSQAGWRDLEAVRSGRIIEIPGDLFARAGRTAPMTVAAIREGMRDGR